METPVREPHELRARRRHGVRSQAYAVVLRCFAEAVGADTAVIVSRSGGRVEITSSWAREGHELSVSWTGESLLAQALDGAGPLVEPGRSATEETLVGAIAAPIRSGGEPLGAIYARFSPATTEDAEALAWAAESYARIVGLCMAGDVTLAAVLGSVGFDVLTGCLSYGGLLEVVKAEVQRSLRGKHRLSCCFIDLDGFKGVNDRQGHLEGNRVLTAVGQALRDAARTYDAIGRFGGDEFVVVLPETGRGAGDAIAQRYRAAVLKAIGEVTPVPVDVSIGVAEWDGAGSGTDLLGAADAALAEAKANGGAAVTGPGAESRVDGLLELTKDLMRRRGRSVIHDGDGEIEDNRRRP